MARLRWLLWLGLGALGVGLAAGFGWLLWRGPAWVYRDAWPQLTAAEQVTATGQFRIALIQVAAAVGAVVALAYTASTYRLANRGQLTERFSKALERLGSEDPTCGWVGCTRSRTCCATWPTTTWTWSRSWSPSSASAHHAPWPNSCDG
jgi:hypothetical protein